MRSNTMDSGLVAALAGITANVIFGTSALYWQALGNLSAETVLVCRIVLSVVTVTAVLAYRGTLRSIVGRITPRLLLVHFLAAACVGVNWGTFIWASLHGRILECGLGYLLSPFVAIAVGALLLGERISRLRGTAIAIIALAVGYLLVSGGDLLHWVYVSIGLSWGGYACLKKWTVLDPISGLLLEAVVLLLVFVPLLALMPAVTLQLPATLTSFEWLLIALCGAVSVFPLALFAFAAVRLPLSAMGILQFVLPITQLIIALAIYHQPASRTTLVCFSIMGLCLALIVAEPHRHRLRAVWRPS